MGAKLSNLGWNIKHNSSNNSNSNINYNRQYPTYPFSSDIPSIVIDDNIEEDMVNKFTKITPSKSIADDNYISKPEVFPKVSSEINSAPTSNNIFRIHPILQNGEKLSDTHYWFLTEPKHKRSHSARMKRNPSDLYINASKFYTDYSNEEPVLPIDRNENISEEYNKYKSSVKRGNSDANKNYFLTKHRELVNKLMFVIPTATEMECKSVLIGANWDFNTAEKRLKIDMLHRKGYVNQQRCNHLLGKHNWDYNKAERDAKREYKFYKYNRQNSSNSIRSTNSDVT